MKLRSTSMHDDDILDEIRNRIAEHLDKEHHVFVNVVATVSLNELLRGGAALLGPCSLMHLEDEPLGTRSVEKLSKVWKMDQPVVLGCRSSQELPLVLFDEYHDIYRFGRPISCWGDWAFHLSI